MMIPGTDGQSIEVMAVTVAEDRRQYVSVVIEDNKTGPVAGIFIEASLAPGLEAAIRAAGLIAQAGNQNKQPQEHPGAVTARTS